jgi:GGDEF domain-containing protein
MGVKKVATTGNSVRGSGGRRMRHAVRRNGFKAGTDVDGKPGVTAIDIADREDTVHHTGTRTPRSQLAAYAVVGGLAALGLASLLPVAIPPYPLAAGVGGAGVAMTFALVATTGRLLRRAEHSAVTHATVHPLTGLGTRHVAELMLAVAFGAAQRGTTLTVVLLRYDEFPRFAARAGRPAAEHLLRNAGRVLRRHTRSMHTSAHHGDAAATWVAILSGIGVEGACVFAKRVRRELMTVPAAEVPPVSAAVVGFDLSMASPAELLERAERVLAKGTEAGGRIIAVGLGARNPA